LIECVDGDEEIARWLDAVPQPYREAEAHAWVDQATSWWHDGTSAPFAVTESKTGRVLGSVGFGWIGTSETERSATGCVATRAAGPDNARSGHLISRWALDELGCARLQLRADLLNLPSQRVAEKAGFTREGVLRSVHFNPRQNRRVDFVMFSLLPGELELPA
jgi:Acetyltransferases, including N-acetylases of ribosomal proteins